VTFCWWMGGTTANGRTAAKPATVHVAARDFFVEEWDGAALIKALNWGKWEGKGIARH
jgi:hypothetical protein